MYLANGSVGLARQDAVAGLRYDPGNAHLHAVIGTEDAALLFNRAAAYGSAGRWADAKADLTRARELDPEDPEISAELRACEERLAVRR
jgi:tetratricopeptide (TPR) repeat protein